MHDKSNCSRSGEVWFVRHHTGENLHFMQIEIRRYRRRIHDRFWKLSDERKKKKEHYAEGWSETRKQTYWTRKARNNGAYGPKLRIPRWWHFFRGISLLVFVAKQLVKTPWFAGSFYGNSPASGKLISRTCNCLEFTCAYKVSCVRRASFYLRTFWLFQPRFLFLKTLNDQLQTLLLINYTLLFSISFKCMVFYFLC